MLLAVLLFFDPRQGLQHVGPELALHLCTAQTAGRARVLCPAVHALGHLVAGSKQLADVREWKTLGLFRHFVMQAFFSIQSNQTAATECLAA